MRGGWGNLVRLDVLALLRLVCDTAALRRVWSATVRKVSRNSGWRFDPNSLNQTRKCF